MVEMIEGTRNKDTRKEVEDCEDCMEIIKKRIGQECEVCGEANLEKNLEKKKREEKEEERKLQGKIRDLRVKLSKNRRETVRENYQPAKKRRKTGVVTFKRVINTETEREKRKEMTGEEEKRQSQAGEGPKLRKIEIMEPELPEGLEYEGGRKKTEEELEEEWREKLRNREIQNQEDDHRREKQIEKAKKLQKGWELMRLCKEMIEENGEKWKKLKERRDWERREEMVRKERLEKAAAKKKEMMDNLEKMKIQKKITENLKILPENRKKLADREKESRRKLLMEEAENEIWRKWRQRKGRGMKSWNMLGENETLEKKLEIVEE